MMIEDLDKDQVYIEEQLLNPAQIGVIQERFNEILGNKNSEFANSYTSWDTEITDNYRAGIVLLKNLDNDAVRPVIKDACERMTGKDCTKAILSVFTAGSYIPWHDDKKFDAAITIHVDDYDWQDGGMFLYTDPSDNFSGIKGYIPRAGAGVYVKNAWHMVTPVLPTRPPRLTVQCWFIED